MKWWHRFFIQEVHVVYTVNGRPATPEEIKHIQEQEKEIQKSFREMEHVFRDCINRFRNQ